nr:hypothetical protein GCM10020092_007460 [Actinoplanes digitatis]
MRSWSVCGPEPPSWPPVNQATRTGVPVAAMPRALASASDSGKRVSTAPWMSSVGALTRSMTEAGLERRSSAVVASSGVPVVAIFRYAAQTSAAKRPQAGSAPYGRGAAAGPPGKPPADDEPLPKNSPAQLFLNTPGAVTAAADCGKNARPRSFQVINGTIASTRGSWAASSSASAPPYEPPTTPTRGSPVASVSTRGCAASQSSSRCASRTS